MTRPYEVVYIFDAALEDEAITQKLASLHALIRSDGAAEPEINVWGRRTLAYPIKKRTTGYYVVANFDAESAALPEFERALKLDDAVIRHLIVLNDEPPTPAQVSTGKGDFEEEA